jgi:hypothetical protein
MRRPWWRSLDGAVNHGLSLLRGKQTSTNDTANRTVMKLCVAMNPQLSALLVLFASLAACADHSAIIRYSHPTPLSRYGREVAVVPFENDSDGTFSQLVANRLQQAGFDIRPLSEARIGVSGEIVQSSIGQEQTGQNPHTCYRSVPELRTRQVPVLVSVPGSSTPSPNNPYYVPPPQTRVEYRTEQYTEMVERPYSCVRLWRSIDAQFRASIRVITRTSPPRAVFSETFSQTDRQQTIGLQGSDSQDRQPPPVDGHSLLRDLQGRIVEQFAQYSTPDQIVSRLRWSCAVTSDASWNRAD